MQCSLRERDNGFALAMTFDPGDAPNDVLSVHAPAIMLGLMQLRGWRRDGQEMLIGLGRDWTDRWWNRPLTGRRAVCALRGVRVAVQAEERGILLATNGHRAQVGDLFGTAA